MPQLDVRSLSEAQIHDFIERGFARIDGAFDRSLADAARAILWREMALDADDATTWKAPVVRLGMYSDAPFLAAANTPTLARAYDQLVGEERWTPCRAMGTFPVRFPSAEDPGDTGWHVDASFDWHRPDFMDWRVNLTSRGRALLMLFLFSDVGDNDAPTRIRVGSHEDIARMLKPAGEAGLTLRELSMAIAEAPSRHETLATGDAGTVYLCHPFLVHAAQPHRGTAPRFLAQPPLFPREALQLQRRDGAYSPVEVAIRNAIGMAA